MTRLLFRDSFGQCGPCFKNSFNVKLRNEQQMEMELKPAVESVDTSLLTCEHRIQNFAVHLFTPE